jgi:hypothetical protein
MDRAHLEPSTTPTPVSHSPAMVLAAASARCCLAVTPIAHHSRPASSAALRLPRRITRPSLSSSASPLVTVASMDAPPQGYRTNVGICLANPSLTKASPQAPILLICALGLSCPIPSYSRLRSS